MGFERVAIILIFYDFVCKKRLLNKSYAVKKTTQFMYWKILLVDIYRAI